MWEAGIEHPSVAERMKRLASEVDLPATDLSWTVASSFLLASLRRRGVLPERIEFSDHRDFFMKLLTSATRDSAGRAVA